MANCGLLIFFTRILQEEVSIYILNYKPLKIIEVACGGGNFTLMYAKPELKIDDFDFSAIVLLANEELK